MSTHTETLARLAMARMARVDPVPYDPRTGEEYALIRVEVDSRTDGQVIPGGIVPAGKSVVEIYENQLPILEALVEDATEEQLAAVAADYERHCRECVGEFGEPENKRAYLPSYEASFRRVMYRDMRPFRSVRRLEPKPRRKAAAGG